jgi:hypothetical protein
MLLWQLFYALLDGCYVWPEIHGIGGQLWAEWLAWCPGSF